MGFHDQPIVHPAAKNCRDSELALENIFKERNGFIARPDKPDYGCDYVIELTESGAVPRQDNATNQRFQVQLKSIETLKIIDDGQLIAYPIETARLGYLFRSQPPVGIIVFYSIEQQCLFYDFFENIYTRIKDRHDSDAWHSQDEITIHIPIDQKLNDQSCRTIHEKVGQWCRNLEKLLLTHGAEFNLPVISLATSASTQVTNISKWTEIIRKHGMQLLQEFDLAFVLDMVGLVPYSEILSTPTVTLVTATAYCEAGMHLDSNYFIEKVLGQDQLTGEDRVMATWIKLRNDYSLGKIDNELFLEQASVLLDNELSEESRLIVELNMIFHRIASSKLLLDISDEFLSQINDIYQRLAGLNLPATRDHQLYLYNTENYAFWIAVKRSKLFADYQLLQSLGTDLTLPEKLKRIRYVTDHTQQLFSRIDSLHKKALQGENKVLEASVIAVKCRFDLMQEIEMFSFGQNSLELRKGNEKQYLHKINLALHAYTLFTETGYSKQALEILCHAAEFLHLAKNYYDFSTSDFPTEERMMQVIKELEAKLNLPPYEMQATKRLTALKINDQNTASLHALTESQLREMAQRVLAAWDLPEGHYPNILLELQALQLFEKRCNQSDIIMQRKFPLGHDRAVLYIEPPIFILYNRKTGLQSVDSTNMDQLLTSWGF